VILKYTERYFNFWNESSLKMCIFQINIPFVLLNAKMTLVSVIHLMHVINLWYGGKVKFLEMVIVLCWIY